MLAVIFKDNARSKDSGHIFVIRENMRLKHRCPFKMLVKWQIVNNYAIKIKVDKNICI